MTQRRRLRIRAALRMGQVGATSTVRGLRQRELGHDSWTGAICSPAAQREPYPAPNPFRGGGADLAGAGGRLGRAALRWLS